MNKPPPKVVQLTYCKICTSNSHSKEMYWKLKIASNFHTCARVQFYVYPNSNFFNFTFNTPTFCLINLLLLKIPGYRESVGWNSAGWELAGGWSPHNTSIRNAMPAPYNQQVISAKNFFSLPACRTQYF